MKDTNCKNCGAPLNENNKCEYCYTIHHYKFETQNNAIEHTNKSSLNFTGLGAVVIGMCIYRSIREFRQLNK